MSKRALDGWTETVGAQRLHRVTVFEHLGRDRVLYLRWRETIPGTTHRRERLESLARTLLDDVSDRLTGRKREAALEAAQAAAVKAAERRYNILTGVIVEAVAAPVVVPAGEWPRTLGATEAKLTDPVVGRFPSDAAGPKGHARSVLRALRLAVSEWGGATLWADVKYDHWVRLWRSRMRALSAEGQVGYAGARDTIVRLAEVVTWLINHEHLPADTRVPQSARWRKDFNKDYALLVGQGDVPTPKRPRYTLDEMLALLNVAHHVDPRLGLALAIGAEQRNGQVLRVKRSQVVRPAVDWTLAGAALLAQDFGTVDVTGRGKKGGAVIDLTPGQRRALDFALGYQDAALGYLRELEAAYVAGQLPDYALFTAQHLRGRRTAPDAAGTWAVPLVDTYGHSLIADPALALEGLSGTQLRHWLRKAEDAVRPEPIRHVEGRAFYGFRRQGVDAAFDEGISDDGIQAHGGWSSPDMARDVYRDQSRRTRQSQREARDVRRRFRREGASESADDTGDTAKEGRTARTGHEQAAGDASAAASLLGESDD